MKTFLSSSEISAIAVQPNAVQMSATAKKKARRAKISSTARRLLQQRFLQNPYLDEQTMALLERDTELPGHVTRTWFANTRSRKAGQCASQYRYPARQLTCLTVSVAKCAEIDRPTEATDDQEEALSPLPVASLEDLNKLAPQDGFFTLDMWLDEPVGFEASSLDPIPITSRIDDGFDSTFRKPSFPSLLSRVGHSSSTQYPPLYNPPLSIAGSDSSVGSFQSPCSISSQLSVDHRGQRKGRQQWKPLGRPAEPPSNISAANSRSPFFDTAPVLPPIYFCTWHDCLALFRPHTIGLDMKKHVTMFPDDGSAATRMPIP